MSTRTLLIDNYDSFTFNLFQLLAEVNGEDPVVVRNDGATWDELADWPFDNIVISPGPGRPDRPADFGVCRAAIDAADVPVLGVCLGHQGLACFAGAAVVHAPEVMHGRLSAVYHGGSPLFADIPQGFAAVRYHSLCVTRPPECLVPIAWTRDGVIMGLAHRDRPQWGVQFHPESICTEHGRRLLANFRDLTAANGRRRPRAGGACVVPRRTGSEWTVNGRPQPELIIRKLERPYDPERAFVHLFGESRHAFWLDSSKAGDARSRFSFIGSGDGPLSALVTYDVTSGEVRAAHAGSVEVRRETIFDYLSRELRNMRRSADELPFDLNGGFVGYFGYELKAVCGGDAVHRSSLPDAAFILADRLIAFDHRDGATYIVCLADRAHQAEGRRWVETTRRRLDALPDPVDPAPAPHHRQVEFRLSRSYETYIDDIRRIKEHLRDGETYEVCLTNRISADVEADPLELYRLLRRVNPAPFSAYLRLGDAAVLSSSPERFLSVGRDRWVEAKPIKGTTRRGATPAEDAALSEELRTSEKNRAENLMITDLLRNDLGLVCEIGTVHVPHLMEIESYETVHQLVSTIRGRLREDLAAPDCVQACFPGGSMTGAPKKRTMEIIDALEHEARGVYSGAIGYLGLGGAADLNIVIRTIVMEGTSLSIGAGGAIVMQSDADDEFQEMLLKAEALMRAIALSTGADAAPILDPFEHVVTHA
ncbi:MAG TPA: aminodeoxychorismate synthase component I [Solirubrobacteraceae bacterium]|nr:aminodeoxychorismate synthase component I [Solirubrobacteraceae bacterium]